MNVIISVNPKECQLIAASDKTIIVKKTRPKIQTPFKCYIYCTKPSKKHQTICGCMVLNDDELYRHPTEGIKHGDSIELMGRDDYTEDNFLNGKVIGEFVCEHIDRMVHCGSCNNDIKLGFDDHYYFTEIAKEYLLKCQLTYNDLEKYSNGGNLYGWHISDLKIYDRPRPLSDFTRLRATKFGYEPVDVERPPQSWFYVEDAECTS